MYEHKHKFTLLLCDLFTQMENPQLFNRIFLSIHLEWNFKNLYQQHSFCMLRMLKNLNKNFNCKN